MPNPSSPTPWATSQITQYCTDVLSNKIVAGRLVRLACKRQLDDWERGDKRGLIWDERAAQKILAFFPHVLRLPEIGSRFFLQPWQQFLIGTLFGWKVINEHNQTVRRFRRAYVEIGKGNGKSPLAGGLGIYMTSADGEREAQCFAAATQQDQAHILFQDAVKMVQASEVLRQRLVMSGTRKVFNIAHPASGSFFRPLSAEHKGLDGKRVHFAALDEVHEHPSDLVVNKMAAGAKGRRQAMIFEITNSGYDRNTVCWHHHRYSEQILEGILENDQWFAYVCGLDEGDDYHNPAIWIKANPNIGVSIPVKYLAESVKTASDMPSEENIVKRLNFCIWCVSYDALVSMADGTRKRADELMGGEVVLAFDETTGKLAKARVGIVQRNPEEVVYRITTKRGRVTTVNGEHKFWCRYGRPDAPKYGWIAARDLTRGSRLGVALGHSLPKGSLRIKTEEAKFIGVMVGDGTCNGTPRITNGDPGLIEFCREFVERRGCRLAALPDGVHWDVRHFTKGSLRRTAIRKLLQRCGLWGKIDRTKRVPDTIFKGGPKVWAAFLSGYFDTDGHFAYRAIYWTSCNPGLLADCQHLLALLGVQSAVGKAGDGYRLHVADGHGLAVLASVLTLSHSVKAARLPAYREVTKAKCHDRAAYDRVSAIERLASQKTIGIEIEKFHTHVTDGLITHNTEQATKWMATETWDACSEPFDPASLLGQTCYGGLDLATTKDLNCLCLLFPPAPERAFWVALWFFWCPKDTAVARSKRDKVPYDLWGSQGLIHLTFGNVTDYDAIRRDIAGTFVEAGPNEQGMQLHDDQCIADKYRIVEIAYDRWNASQLVAQLEADGMKMVPLGQGFQSMSAPMKEVERICLNKTFSHGGNPIARWNLSNVSASQDPAGNIKPDKERSSERIDGIVAMIDAMARAMTQVTDGGQYRQSIFDNGPIVL